MTDPAPPGIERIAFGGATVVGPGRGVAPETAVAEAGPEN